MLGYTIANLIWARYIHTKDRHLKNHQDICNMVTGIHDIDSYLWVFFYMIALLVWQYPVIHLFWIKQKKPFSQLQTDRTHQSLNSDLT